MPSVLRSTVALTALSESEGNTLSWKTSTDDATFCAHSKTYLVEDMSVMSSAPRPAPYSYTNGISSKLNSSDSNPHKNSDSRPSKTSYDSETSQLQPQRLNVLARQASNLSGTGSEPDSLLDMYVSRSGKSSTDPGEGRMRVFDDDERSRWIHRDKLLRIESQEMQQAGIHLGRDSRVASRTASRQTSTQGLRDQSRADFDPSQLDALHAFTIPDEEEAAMSAFDLRRPEEAYLDLHEIRTPVRKLKPGYSKIPLSKSSPAPVPLDFIERPSPLHWPDEEEAAAMRLQDSPLRSSESAFLDDEPLTPTSRPDSDGSPSKRAFANGSRRPSSGKSGTSSILKTRTKSINKQQTNQRPGTSKGETPPGDPPWLDSIYSPDPRLPPDQQMLPTLAKRMQQQKWEKAGAFANSYDRDFQPLKIVPDNELNVPLKQELDQGQHQTEWPLKSPKDLTPAWPSTSGTLSGGYKTMPTVAPGAKAEKQDLIRLPDAGDEDEKKGAKCACCIIM